MKPLKQDIRHLNSRHHVPEQEIFSEIKCPQIEAVASFRFLSEIWLARS